METSDKTLCPSGLTNGFLKLIENKIDTIIWTINLNRFITYGRELVEVIEYVSDFMLNHGYNATIEDNIRSDKIITFTRR